ncbi:hypothetical protein [Nocardia sp. NPDC005366]|uniref:hypothetical protein n=1 Tax=Nocardia sp. NPDC005366 TaxID=3156878 RepID=UPI0033B76582
MSPAHIAVEDFKPLFLAKSTLARKAADAAIGAAKRELIERARRAGRKVVLVRPAYMTMTCSSCFVRAKRLDCMNVVSRVLAVVSPIRGTATPPRRSWLWQNGATPVSMT